MVGLTVTGCQPVSKFITATLKPLCSWLPASVSPRAAQVVRTEDNVPLRSALLGETLVPQSGEQAPLFPSQNSHLVPWDQSSELSWVDPGRPHIAPVLGSEWKARLSWHGVSATRSTGRSRATVVSGSHMEMST